MALGDRVAVLLDGAIVQCAPPELVYDQPCCVAVARLFGDPPMNLWPCRPEADPAGLRVDIAGMRLVLDAAPRAAGTPCLLGLRPETLTLAAEGRAGAAAEVIAATPLHERMLVLLRGATGEEIVASVASGRAPAPGQTVFLSADAAMALLFDAISGERIPPRRAVAGKAA